MATNWPVLMEVSCRPARYATTSATMTHSQSAQMIVSVKPRTVTSQRVHHVRRCEPLVTGRCIQPATFNNVKGSRTIHSGCSLEPEVSGPQT
ncbi:MAG: hypothetical protein ACRDZ4_04930 [Egibacteraceae bacterium]